MSSIAKVGAVSIILMSLSFAVPVQVHSDDAARRVSELVAKRRPYLFEVFKDLHQHPELSDQEERTSAKLTAELSALGYVVTSGVGHRGVVAVLRNGEGPTALIRADMDALPIQEQTDLPYKSGVPGVMHACGHDFHMAALLGTAYVLKETTDLWKGTLVLIGQPAEEIVKGAEWMIADGLFTRFPKPAYALALHDSGIYPSGDILIRAGAALASVDTVEVILNGRGGHASMPHLTVDPIVLGAEYVLKMQTLVGREVNPTVPALITVGSFHAGTKSNIIPDSAKLQMTIRTMDETVRSLLTTRVVEIARELSKAARAPEPQISFPEATPSQTNDPGLVQMLEPVFARALGKEHIKPMPLMMGAEDFSVYGIEGKIPEFLFWVGSTDPTTPTPWPGNHTAKFKVDFNPTFTTGVTAMVRAVLTLQQSGAHPVNGNAS